LETILQPILRKDGRGRPWRDTCAVLNGVLWVLGTGAQWRELPSKYPPYQTCHRRFQQWVRDGKLDLDLHGRRSPRSERIRASLAQLATGSPAGLRTRSSRLAKIRQ
jgi:transposase